jgi:ferric-dicitrate binding protein FerR (iron transport regulator)
MIEIDALIQKYLREETSEAENNLLIQWIDESPENKKRLFADKDIWDMTALSNNSRDYNVEHEAEILRQRIGRHPQIRQINWRNAIQIAAILLVSFGLGWFGRTAFTTSGKTAPAVSMQEVIVPKGQVNQVFLADGTRIWVNSETRLTFPSVFDDHKREINLDGEAFFEVAPDKNRPFRVTVNGEQIEVLGTSFNVRAYSNSGEIETTLETGQIRLLTGNRETLLHPGEQSHYNKANKQVAVHKVNPATFICWKEGRYEFLDENLDEVFKVVERWYDVQIQADETYFSGMHFSGVIKRNKDVKHFLDLLNITTPIRYEIKADKITIRPGK